MRLRPTRTELIEFLVRFFLISFITAYAIMITFLISGCSVSKGDRYKSPCEVYIIRPHVTTPPEVVYAAQAAVEFWNHDVGYKVAEMGPATHNPPGSEPNQLLAGKIPIEGRLGQAYSEVGIILIQHPLPEGYDLVELIRHEIGHIFLLNHVNDPANLMYPSQKMGPLHRAIAVEQREQVIKNRRCSWAQNQKERTNEIKPISY